MKLKKSTVLLPKYIVLGKYYIVLVLISLLFNFFPSLRLGDQATVFCIISLILRLIDSCHIKRFADQYHEAIPRAQVSILSRAHVRLTCCKQGKIVRKPVNVNLGLKVK